MFRCHDPAEVPPPAGKAGLNPSHLRTDQRPPGRARQAKKMEEGPRKTLIVQRERVKAQIRAKVEHPFHVVKNLIRHRKVRYRGLLKNTAQLSTLFGLANLVLARRLNPSPSS